MPPPMRGRRSGGYRRAMPSATQPLPPASSGLAVLRRGAAWLHLALAAAIALGVFAAGLPDRRLHLRRRQRCARRAHQRRLHRPPARDAARLVALVAWLPRADLGLSLLMALFGTAQIALASADGWAGGLHPLGALLVLVLAAAIVRRDLQRRGAAAA